MLLCSTIAWFLIAKVRGGSFVRLADADLQRVWALILAFLTRTALYRGVLSPPPEVAGLIHTAAFLLLCFSLLPNLRIRGMPLAFIGTLLNTVVIALNGGRMPVSGAALVRAGIWEGAGGALRSGAVLTHSLALENTRMGFLGDVLSIRWPWGGGVVYSVGDLLLIAGMYFIIQQLMGAETTSRVG